MSIQPLKKQNRIHELDVFRGFAILGIFMVNILVMNMCFAYRGEWEMEQTGWLQQTALFILETIFYSKFFTIFSFLFGIGVALQIQRAKQKGNFSNAFFIRRFGSLFLFGVMHILFLWSGDILHLYGILGFALLLFFRGSAKFLLWATIVIFLFPFYTVIFEQIVEWLSFDHSAPLASLSRAEVLELKHHGSYLSGVTLRLKEYAFAMGLIYSGIAPVALTMMLLGGYIVKKGWLENIYDRLIKIRVYLFSFLVLLLAYRFFVLYWILPNYEIPFGSALSIALHTVFQLSDIVISLSLLWIVGYLWHSKKGKTLLSPLRYVGRMALSNYILQSVLGYFIMRTLNGYEYFSPAGCMLLVTCIYLLQIVLSKMWLKHYKLGPLEWCWRCISYARILPIRSES